MLRRRPDFEPGEAGVKSSPKDDAFLGTPQLNLHKLSDADGLKSGGCPTPAEPIFESRAV
ncbi:MAG: hypothetical protein HY069_00115 [Chlamydiia bacterium]|nr:hypothetical protein [Chlamydiia bacterium]